MPADLDALKAEHKAVYTLDVDDLDEPIVFRRAKKAEYKEFLSKGADDRARIADLQEQLARSVVIYPSKQEFAALLDDYPGLASKVANEVMQLAMGARADEAKKV